MIAPEEHDRWASLAEELGLPPEGQEMRAASPVAPQANKPSVDAAEAEPSEPPPAVEDEPPARGRRRRSPSAASVEVKAKAPGKKAAPDEEERPRRRRRRRGSKATVETEAGSAETPTIEASSASPAEGEEASDDERPRRRRRRGKITDKDNEPQVIAETEAEELTESVAEEPARDDEDDEDEETEDFSTWNVPVWAEIIAGLYRPDR
jgi:ribonuclease E